MEEFPCLSKSSTRKGFRKIDKPQYRGVGVFKESGVFIAQKKGVIP
jgi:hypothetical protein